MPWLQWLSTSQICRNVSELMNESTIKGNRTHRNWTLNMAQTNRSSCFSMGVGLRRDLSAPYWGLVVRLWHLQWLNLRDKNDILHGITSIGNIYAFIFHIDLCYKDTFLGPLQHNMPWYYTWLCKYSRTKKFRFWRHKGSPISRREWCLLWEFWRKNGHCLAQSTHLSWPHGDDPSWSNIVHVT